MAACVVEEYTVVDLERKKTFEAEVRATELTHAKRVTMQDMVAGNIVHFWFVNACAERGAGVWTLPDGTKLPGMPSVFRAATAASLCALRTRGAALHVSTQDAWQEVLHRLDQWGVSYPAWYRNYDFKLVCTAEKRSAMEAMIRTEMAARKQPFAEISTVQMCHTLMSTQIGEELKRRECNASSTWLKSQRDPSFDASKPVSDLYSQDACRNLAVIVDNILSCEVMMTESAVLAKILKDQPHAVASSSTSSSVSSLSQKGGPPQWVQDMIDAENAKDEAAAAASRSSPYGSSFSNRRENRFNAGASASAASSEYSSSDERNRLGIEELESRMRQVMSEPKQVEAHAMSKEELDAIAAIRAEKLRVKNAQDALRAKQKLEQKKKTNNNKSK